MVSQTMPVGELQERVTKVVLDILNDNKRRALVPKSTNPFSVITTDTTETECAPEFTAAAVVCYAAKITIDSDGKIAAAISKLKDLLERGVDQQGIFVTGNKQGIAYPPVKITNQTPYEAYSGFVDYDALLCRNDVYSVASG